MNRLLGITMIIVLGLGAWTARASGDRAETAKEVLLGTEDGVIETPYGNLRVFTTLGGTTLTLAPGQVLAFRSWSEVKHTYDLLCDSARTAGHWTGAGEFALEFGNLAEAHRCWAKALELDPRWEKARELLMQYTYSDGRVPKNPSPPPTPVAARTIRPAQRSIVKCASSSCGAMITRNANLPDCVSCRRKRAARQAAALRRESANERLNAIRDGFAGWEVPMAPRGVRREGAYSCPVSGCGYTSDAPGVCKRWNETPEMARRHREYLTTDR